VCRIVKRVHACASPVSPGAKNHSAFAKSFFAFAKIIFVKANFGSPKKYSKKYRKTLDNRCPDVVLLQQNDS